MAPLPPPEKYRLDQLAPGQAFYIPAHNLEWGAAVAADAQERLGRPFIARRCPPGLEIVAGEASVS